MTVLLLFYTREKTTIIEYESVGLRIEYRDYDDDTVGDVEAEGDGEEDVEVADCVVVVVGLADATALGLCEVGDFEVDEGCCDEANVAFLEGLSVGCDETRTGVKLAVGTADGAVDEGRSVLLAVADGVEVGWCEGTTEVELAMGMKGFRTDGRDVG